MKPENVIKDESFKPRPEHLSAPVDDAHENLDTTARPMVLTSPLELHIRPEDTINRGSLRPRSAQCRVPSVGAQTKLPTVDRNELKLHVGGGNVMSYRWIARAVANPNHGGGVLGAMEALHTSQEAMGLQVAHHEPFLLIAVPGLFMTLDSMERWLGGLLEFNHHGKILLVSTFHKLESLLQSSTHVRRGAQPRRAKIRKGADRPLKFAGYALHSFLSSLR